MILRCDIPPRRQGKVHSSPPTESEMTYPRQGKLYGGQGAMGAHTGDRPGLQQRIYRGCGVLMVLVLLVAISSPVCAEPRIALLIGNQAYTDEVGPLENPINDIAQVGDALEKIGFTVEQVRNARFGDLHKAVNRYVRRLREAGDGTIGFFYYSGHGGANPVDKRNYLIPVDVRSADEEQLWDDSIWLDSIIDKLSKEAFRATHFVIFDACRNELQLKKKGTKALAHRKGFQPEKQHPGMLIAYATAPGELASDEGVGAGPYAKALAEELVKPGVQALVMFQNVQEKVRTATGQLPWLTSPYLPKIYLAGGTAEQPEPKTPPPSVTFTGNVQVNVNVPGTVYIEGKRAGEAGPGRPLNITDVRMGMVEVKVDAKGFESAAQMANVEKGQWEQLTFVLKPEGVCSDQSIARRILRSTSARLSWRQLRGMVQQRRFTATIYNKSARKFETFDGSFRNAFKRVNEIVADCATGLMWQRSTYGPYSFAEAQAYINRLNQERFAGYSNWRLPTTEELASLTQSKGFEMTFLNPKLHLDPNFFHGNGYHCMSCDRVSDPSVSDTASGEAVFGITWAGPGGFAMIDVAQVSPVKAVRTMEQ